ncbi:MAG: hypothetical protein DRG78_16180 [Epsilonproteobacteria bacterium]|nr:MAG: hypothetical protein DRG78_16180 [Campylobacterota bacterium]
MMLKPDNIYKIAEKIDSMYSIFFGSLLIFSASVMLIINELNIADSNSHWITRIVGFIVMLVAATVMKRPLSKRIERISYINTFSLGKDPMYAILILGSGLTMTAIFTGLILMYVPFIGNVIAGLFAYGYFYVMQKLSKSKSGAAKAVYIVMILVVLLTLLAISAFFYLTREG